MNAPPVQFSVQIKRARHASSEMTGSNPELTGYPDCVLAISACCGSRSRLRKSDVGPEPKAELFN
jgi:hypothetical protein